MADSKTGKKAALAAQVPVEKKVIPDEERVRLLRLEVVSNIYPSSENTKALLRTYDAVLLSVKSFEADVTALNEYIVAAPYGTLLPGENVLQMVLRVLKMNDVALIELDKTATALEARAVNAEEVL